MDTQFLQFKTVKGAQAWEFFAGIFYTISEPIWVWLGDWTKKCIFYYLTPDFEGFWFYAAYWVCRKQTKIWKLGKNLKLVVVVFGPICLPTMSFWTDSLESISGLLKSLKILSLIYSSFSSHGVRHHFTFTKPLPTKDKIFWKPVYSAALRYQRFW